MALTHHFSDWCRAVLENKLSRRMKKLIFVAALSAALEKTNTPSDRCMAILNDVFPLSARDSALKLPIYLQSVVWHGKTEADFAILSESPSELAKHIADFVPSWLTYARSENMANDAAMVKMLTDGGWSDEAVVNTKMSFRVSY